MADSNQLKRIDPIDFGQDDPFAELTKIMGFDPRQPARPQDVAKTEAPSPARVVEAKAPAKPEFATRAPEPQVEVADDFAIDLERELLGDFDYDSEPAQSMPPVTIPAAAVSRAAVPASVAETEATGAAELDFDFGEDLAAELESGLAVVEPSVETQAEAPPAADENPFADLDFSVDDEAHEQAAVVAEAASAPLPGSGEDERLQEEIDLDFDVAMAEVDMEFDAELDGAFVAAVDEAVASDEDELEQWTPEQNPEEDLDRVIGELDAAAHTAPAFDHAGFEGAPAFGDDTDRGAEHVEVHADEVAAQPELSFEDELKTLLGAPVQPAVLAGYDEPLATDATEDEWEPAEDGYTEAEVETGQHETGQHAAWAASDGDALDFAEAFDDSAFDTAFEQELAAEPAPRPSASSRPYAPEIETVQVPESGIAHTDEIDIPELDREEPVPAMTAFDDYEPDYSELFAQPADSSRGAHLDRRAHDRHDRDYEDALAATAAATAAITAGSGRVARAERGPADADFSSGAHLAPRQVEVAPSLVQDDGFDEPLDFSDVGTFDDVPEPRRRGLLIAAVVGGVALLGGVGAFAFSLGGGGDADVPALVRADSEPVKVRPEEPGGVTVPNQDNKVFETMAGNAAADKPVQERLNSSSEEPVDIASRVVDPAADQPRDLAVAPSKNEDRVVVDEAEPSDTMEVAAVAPRKVKTMIVRPDGTLVPRDEPAAGAAAPLASSAETAAPVATAEAPLPGTEPVAAVAPDPATPVAPEAVSESAPVAATTETPPSAPVAPARPADQPVDVVGEVAPERVALTTPAGGWAVQIASQPSEEAAKSTYADLSRRYASIIGEQPASIVKAEIAGKGTFWRVRIAADSRNDAIGLCERYKAAGGNCFVSK
ncbi:MAG: SPOR domain-containing protein [Rhizobiaceae bacterium]